MDGLYSHDVEEHYKILSPVGKGGMGTVFKARHKELGSFAAIKILNRELARTRVQRERFFREAKTSANLNHPNIVKVYEVGYCREVPSIVMEYLEGETLFDKFQSGLTLAEGLNYIVQATEALVFAHEEGVIHRDLKPANVIVDQEGVAKVADWGLAKTSTDETGLTKTGVIVGTPVYMAPEQVLGQEPGPFTDLYALGVMLYQLCAKKAPFEGAITDVLSGKMKQKAPSLARCGRALPVELVLVVDNLLERDVAKRSADARAVLASLKEIQKGLLSKPSVSTAKTQTSRVPQRNETVVSAMPENERKSSLSILFLVIGLIIGAAVTYLYLGNEPEPLPPLISTVRLTKFNEIVLSLTRQPREARLKCTVCIGKGKKEEKEQIVSGDSLNTSLTLPVKLDEWVFQPCKLLVDVKEGALGYKETFLLEPRELLDALFQPLDGLKGKRLDRLVKDVIKMSSRLHTMREEKIDEKVRLSQLSLSLKQRLQKEGFTSEYCKGLELTLPKLFAKRLVIGTVLDKRLMPLRHIERSFVDYVCPDLPWNICVTKAMGFEFGEGSLPDFEGKWRRLWSTSFKVRSKNPKSPVPDDPKWYRYSWLDEWDKVREYRGYALASEGAFQSAVTAVIQMDLLEPDETRPYTDDLETMKVIRARLKAPTGAAWPPKEALIGFSIKLFGPEALLSLRVNEGPAILLTNAGNHHAKTRYPADKNTWFTLPISPTLLKVGLNSFYFEPLRAPGPDRLIPICLKECKLWIR